MANIFSLKRDNKKLLEENTRLKNQLLVENSMQIDTTTYIGELTLKRKGIEYLRKYEVYNASVVGNTTSLPFNYIVLEKGSENKINKDMAVVTFDNCLVGLTVQSNRYYTKVMSLLNRNCKVSAMFKKNKYLGNIEWDGTSPDYVIINNVSLNFEVLPGDTIVTSNYSANYQPNILIGTITNQVDSKNGAYRSFKVKVAADFSTLRMVYVIENIRHIYQEEMEEQ
ncbi:MAG: rod shape-determining protein MreC [Sediminibacterium sp.]|nr:rod shape-determining protein MreC [Sediminibacterium sp.]